MALAARSVRATVCAALEHCLGATRVVARETQPDAMVAWLANADDLARVRERLRDEERLETEFDDVTDPTLRGTYLGRMYTIQRVHDGLHVRVPR